MGQWQGMRALASRWPQGRIGRRWQRHISHGPAVSVSRFYQGTLEQDQSRHCQGLRHYRHHHHRRVPVGQHSGVHFRFLVGEPQFWLTASANFLYTMIRRCVTIPENKKQARQKAGRGRCFFSRPAICSEKHRAFHCSTEVFCAIFMCEFLIHGVLINKIWKEKAIEMVGNTSKKHRMHYTPKI